MSKRPKATHKETEAILQDAEAQGFRVEQAKGRGNTHFLVYGPDGRLVSNFASTPSDWRGLRNSLSYLKKAGYKPRK